MNQFIIFAERMTTPETYNSVPRRIRELLIKDGWVEQCLDIDGAYLAVTTKWVEEAEKLGYLTI